MDSPNKKKSLNSVKFRSVLRIRPLLGKERDDQVVLEPLEGGFAVALHPPVVKEDEATFLNALVSGQDLEFTFDSVLSKDTNQEKAYSVIGQPIALQAMEPFKHFSESEQPLDTKSCKKNQLLICMGLPNSGSSFTCTGPMSNRKNDSDGLIPRLFESLFLQCRHINAMSSHKSITFGVNFTAVQVNQSKKNSHECHLYDLVKRSSESTSFLRVFGQTKSTLFDITVDKHLGDEESTSGIPANAIPVFCSSAAIARDCLKAALQLGRQTSQKEFQSHLFISVQPFLVSQNSVRILIEGGSICFLKMAGFDSKQRATRSREPSGLDAHSAIMHCLKAVRHNQISLDGHRKIPYLQHEVTALLMPLCPLEKCSLSVTLLVTASPSIRDYSDKKNLLSEVSQVHVPPPAGDVSTGLSSISSHEKLRRTSRNQPRVRHYCTEDKLSINSISKSSTLLSAGMFEDLRPPLPPPIVLGFTERNDHLIGTCFAEATAPVETFTESAPGKRGCLTTNRPLIENGVYSYTGSPIPLRTFDENADVGNLMPGSMFDYPYLKHINKVVHISRKKGRDLMKTVAVTAVDKNPGHAEERVSELEKQTEQLLFEINELRLRNQELEDRIHRKNDVVPAKSTIYASVMNPLMSRVGDENICSFNFSSAGNTKFTEILNKSDSHRSTNFIEGSTREDCNEEITFSRRESSVGLNENSLFQYIAKLSGENESSNIGNDLQKGHSDGMENDNNENGSDSELDHDLSNSGMTTIFDDRLIRHMAMMNSNS
jgi:hypothetical protein